MNTMVTICDEIYKLTRDFIISSACILYTYVHRLEAQELLNGMIDAWTQMIK